ncbi:MAG: transporter substrate-binding domain-containing protein [Proteobacteria bacterium]|nr:transporter substrate-binding domain-containing protein [Burkholderiales bacterium]
MAEASSAVVADLAPTGRLRAGLNFSNVLLTARDAAGRPTGVAFDLAHELGRRLGVGVDIIEYPNPGKLAESADQNLWDVGFLGAEPARAVLIDFSAAYVEIEATYLVRNESPLSTIADVDSDGVRVVVPGKAAYGLWLTANLKRAKLTGVDTADTAAQRFMEENFDALAGLRDRLSKDVTKLSGTRLLEGKFASVQQAAGTPKGRAAGFAYLCAFIEDVKATGLVAKLIETHKVGHGLTVAPPAGLGGEKPTTSIA